MRMQGFDAPVLEEIAVAAGDESSIAGEFDVDQVGWFGSSLVKSIGKVAKSVGKAATSVVKSPVFEVGVGVLAVAFPVVGIPAAAAVATANAALKTAATSAAAAQQLNAKLSKLKADATKGSVSAAHAVNAMQVALAAQKAKALGMQRLRPVAIPGRGSFSTTPIPLAKVQAAQVPTSLYAPTQTTTALAAKLAAGGSPIGRQVLAAISAGKSVAIPNGLAVVPGRQPLRPAKMWVGKPPKGTTAHELKGAHAVTKGGFVLAGQAVFVA